MSSRKRLLVIATLDTKGREAAYIKECAEGRGVKTMLMDVGTLGPPQAPPDLTRDDLASAAGSDLAASITKQTRSNAVRTVQTGGAIIATRLQQRGQIDGVIGLGGGTGTAIVTSIMRSLPFGFPKVAVSTVASRDVREYVGTKDILMFHSVADLLGFNDFMRHILAQAAYAVCGMMEKESTIRTERPMVGVTAYGINSGCAVLAEPLLDARGYDMIGFHANGCGGMAMEEMIAEGLIAGALDFNPHEIADEMFGGYCKGIGPERLETAGRMGIPLIFAPGGLDNAVFSPYYPMPDELKGRRIHGHDTRFCVRMEAPEMEKFARIVAEKLNKGRGPARVLIPTKGWSDADKQGMALFDPAVDRIFTEKLKSLLDPRIPVEELDVHISEPAFAERAVDILDGMIRASRAGTL
ncbi:MAG TPA: Tm-1-like ATP-binding domain-containing protein [Syntrophorhabdales bacterium]|nr:Tm-1-like ATP-binding domain-containing protein [Syntrophorhabdales bacterium]